MKTAMWDELSLVIALVLLSTASGCGVYIRNATPPPAPCSIETLLLNEDVFPETWQIGSVGDPADRFGVEFEFVRFTSRVDGIGFYSVYREWDERRALRSWRSLTNSYFNVREGWTAWVLPPDLTYQSSIADQLRLSCRTEYVTGQQRCQFTARYGVYIVWIVTDMSEVMTYSDFERILREIDHRMADCLGRPLRSSHCLMSANTDPNLPSLSRPHCVTVMAENSIRRHHFPTDASYGRLLRPTQTNKNVPWLLQGTFLSKNLGFWVKFAVLTEKYIRPPAMSYCLFCGRISIPTS
jgi:hypothetical protein